MIKRTILKTIGVPFSVLLVQALAFVPLLSEAAPAQLTAKEILEKMENAYSSFGSYTDHGTVSDSSTRLTREFKTVYDRPSNRFLFESAVNSQPTPVTGRNFLAVWGDGKVITSSFHGKLETEKSLGLAVAGLGGVSQGASRRVIVMLEPKQVTGLRMTRLVETTVSKQEAIDGYDCFVVSGKHPKSKDVYELWIDRSNHVLRKLRAKESGNIHEEHWTDIRINSKLTSEQFQHGK